jgi:hypothetical protein
MLLLMPCGYGLVETIREPSGLLRPALAGHPAVQRQNVIAWTARRTSRPGRVVEGISLPPRF